MSNANLKLVAERSPARVALATAIAEHSTAERDLRAAREAVEKARDRQWDAQHRLAALQERPAEATANPATAFISAMQAGRDADVAELSEPKNARAAEEADIQGEIEALRKTRAALDAFIVEREGATVNAKGRVKDAVAEVLRSETDVSRLLKEASAVASDIVARRCELLQLRSLLPLGDEKKAIDSLLARPWLIHELNNAYVSHPAAQAVSRAHAALMRDADAPLSE
jgi:predicted  nucleic acid-binding Zn-ribbon protein